MIDRKVFFDEVRARLFQGRLSQRQVDGMNAILDRWETEVLNGQFSRDLHWLAYMLATVKWETASTMWPIEEYGKGQRRAYGVPDRETGATYYGRGFVQLTWKVNYQKMGDKLGMDLVEFPEKALELPIATEILFRGMQDGDFTGVGLGRYFNDRDTDWVNARRIINGTDHAATIAELAQTFYAILNDASKEKAA